MLLLVADENFNNDIVRVQEVGLRGAEDPVILDWAANEGRVVLTHDAATMAYYAYERVRAGVLMPGVIEVADEMKRIRSLWVKWSAWKLESDLARR
jgi:hypothetical protein